MSLPATVAHLKSASATMMSMLGHVAAACPRPVSLALGRRLGDLMRHIVRSRRRLTLSNLQLALGDELSLHQRRQIMRGVFRTFGQTLVETLLLPGMVQQGLEQFVDVQGWEHLEAAVKPGRGAIIFTGHFGNWELVALNQGARGIPMDVVGRPPGDADLAQRLMATRRLTGNRSISKYNAVRPMLRSLKEGRTVGLVVDQNVGSGHGIFVDFFGRQAATTPALAVLALKTGVPVLPVFGYPQGGGHHRIVYGPPLEIPRHEKRRENIMELTSRATAIIEAEVRRYPELWLWMHNRWRSRPDGETPTSVEAA